MLLAIWRFRNFILSSIKAELKTRFARSRFGALWFILHPLAQSAIFAIILSEVLGARLDGTANKSAYAIYLMAGMAAWGLFSEIVNRCLAIFIDYGSMLKKIAFPRIALPLIVGGSALVNHILLLGAMFVVFLFLGHSPGLTWFALPIGTVLILMFGFGLGVLLGLFNVFARDVAQVMSVVMQIWFWLTPIVYTTGIVPERFRWLIELNPMVPLVGIYQDIILFDKLPDPRLLVVPVLLAAGLFSLSFFVFRRASPELVDAL